MKSFMSAQLQESEKVTPANPAAAKECSDCSVVPKRTSGQESIEQTGTETKEQPTQEAEAKPDQVVVMQGPLGTAITEALNKSLSKQALAANVQVPGVALENSMLDYIQANGQINNAPAMITKFSKSTGLVPETDDAPTAVNTLLDCASRVEDIEFILINKIESAPSNSMVPQKSIVEAIGTDGVVANESLVIDSVQVLVTYRKGIPGAR